MTLDLWRQDQCLTCYLCQSACPVVDSHPGFLGPKVLGPELLRLDYESQGRGGILDNLDLCAGCGLCGLACPVGVKIPDLILLARGRLLDQKETGQGIGRPIFQGRVSGRLQLMTILGRVEQAGRRAWRALRRSIRKTASRRERRRWLLAHPELPGRLLTRWPRLGVFLTQPWFRRLLEVLFGVDKGANLPPYRNQRQAEHSRGERVLQGRRVAYFTGCYARYNDPGLGRDVAGLLEGLGAEVVIPPQTCCGTPALHNGDLVEATRKAGYNLKIFLPLVWGGYDIVTACPSCGLAWKREYREALALPEAEELVGHVFDLSEYLAERWEGSPAQGLALISGGAADCRTVATDQPAHDTTLVGGDLTCRATRGIDDPAHGATLVTTGSTHTRTLALSALADATTLTLTDPPLASSRTPGELIYHTACHLRAQGIGTPSVALLEGLTGQRLEQLPLHCCGLSGTYGMKVEKADLSARIGEELFAAIRASGKKTVVTECASCALQIERYTGVRTIHPAKLLVRQLGVRS